MLRTVLLTVITLAVAPAALANQYEHFIFSCDVVGTQQTIWATEVQLPAKMRANVEAGTLSGCFGDWNNCKREIMGVRAQWTGGTKALQPTPLQAFSGRDPQWKGFRRRISR